MKSVSRMFFLILVLTVVFSSAAAADDLIPLSNNKILSILKDKGYHDMLFFQPSVSERDDINSSSDAYLSELHTYPVIGIQDDAITLFILKKQENEWNLQTVGNSALNRENLSLFQFSMNEDYTSGFHYVDFQYVFENDEETELTLTLMLSDTGTSFFSGMRTGDTTFQLNYDRGITLIFDFAFYGRYSFEVMPKQDLSFEAEKFDFSLLPLSAFDFLEPADFAEGRNRINLFYFPDDTWLPVFSVESGEEIQIFPNDSFRKWVLAYYNHGFFFVHAEELQPAAH